LERLSKFHDPETKDVVRFFGPCLESMSRAANLDPAVLADWLATQGPTSNRDSIHAFVRSITEAPVDEMAEARLRQARLDRDVAADAARPRSEFEKEREKVLSERKLPLAKRSRDSIYREMWELSSGCIRVATDDGGFTSGARVRKWQYSYGDPCYDVLCAEINRRDWEADGLVEHVPARKLSGPEISAY